MVLPNCEELKEVVPDDGDGDVCRLQNGLNTNCLLFVLEYVSVKDLCHVSKLGLYFQELIGKWIMSKKLLHLDLRRRDEKNEIDSQGMEIFKIFGKWIRKLKIEVDNNKYFLETIIKYSAPATITELELNCRNDTQPDINMLNQSMPFFSNLRKLNLILVRNRIFLEKISISASKLETLKLQNVLVNGGWLGNMQNLSELEIIRPQMLSFEDLKNYLCTNKKLKVFTFVSEKDLTTISDVLLKYCNGLKTFGDIHACKDRGKDIILNHAIVNRYNFLSTFTDLRNLTLTSWTHCGCELYYTLMNLAIKKIVELKLFINVSSTGFHCEEEKNYRLRSSIADYNCLQTLEIEITSTRCDLEQLKFILHFVASLKNLQKVTLKGQNITNVNKILQAAPNLRTLSISGTISQAEIQQIVRILRTRLKDGKADLIINDKHWSAVKEYQYGIKSIMTNEVEVRRFLSY